MTTVRMLSIEWNYHYRVAMSDRDAMLFLGIISRAKLVKRDGYSGPYVLDDEAQGNSFIERAEVVDVILPDDEAAELRAQARIPIVDVRDLP